MNKILLITAAMALTSAQAFADDAYIGANTLSGPTIGYTAKLDRYWNARFEISQGITTSKDGLYAGETNMRGSNSTRMGGIYGDWFAFGNGFRFNLGLIVNDITTSLSAAGDSTGFTTINGKAVDMRSGGYYNVYKELPKITGYLGVGYGHNKGQRGLGFYADAGAIIAQYTTRVETNLVGSQLTQADVDANARKIAEDDNKWGLIPVVSAGLLYRF